MVFPGLDASLATVETVAWYCVLRASIALGRTASVFPVQPTTVSGTAAHPGREHRESAPSVAPWFIASPNVTFTPMPGSIC